MATNITFENPILPVTGNVNIEREARNHALGLGLIDTAAAAAESTRGTIQYVYGDSGTADGLLVTLKDSADAYTNFDLYPAATGRQPTIAGASNLTLGLEDSGSLIICGAGEDYVLPALATAGIGANALRYEFLVTTTATTFTITCATGDFFLGGVTVMSTNVGAENDAFSADGSTHLSLSMNGTTQGGIVGSYVRLWGISATQWGVHGNLIGSGTIVTPFGT
jgi:hypothetical protein